VTDAPSPITWLVEQHQTFDGLPADDLMPTDIVRPVPVTIPYPTHGLFVGSTGSLKSTILRLWVARLVRVGYDVVLIDGQGSGPRGGTGHLRLLMDAPDDPRHSARLGVWTRTTHISPGLTLYDGNPRHFQRWPDNDQAAFRAAYVPLLDALAHAPPTERPCLIVLDNMGDDEDLVALAPELTALLDALDAQGRALWLTLHDGTTMLAPSPLASLLPRLPMRVLRSSQRNAQTVAGLGFDPLARPYHAEKHRHVGIINDEIQRRWAAAQVPTRLLPRLLRTLRLAPPPPRPMRFQHDPDPGARSIYDVMQGRDWWTALRTPDGAVVHGYASPRPDEVWLVRSVWSGMP
jgi:hypothetical protein